VDDDKECEFEFEVDTFNTQEYLVKNNIFQVKNQSSWGDYSLKYWR
jgi:hypothetical protein